LGDKAVIIGHYPVQNDDSHAKNLDVVAAIIEQDGKFCWRSARPTPISRECGSLPAAKWNPAKPAAGAGARAAGGAGDHARPECYIASHQREVSAA
jgi:(d)CTP diphosphatase